MKTYIKHKSALFALLLIAGLIAATTGTAQTSLDRSELPRPATDASSCQDVDWNETLYNRYPWVKDSCHEVIVVDGQKWARFEAEFMGMNRDGSFDVDFLNRLGRSEGIVTLKPAANQTVMLDNREYTFQQLLDTQKLNFYVPEGVDAFAVEPGAPRSELVAVVEPEQTVTDNARFAQTKPRQNGGMDRLPATAGPLPMFAVGGLFAMLGGLGMSLRRRSMRKQV